MKRILPQRLKQKTKWYMPVGNTLGIEWGFYCRKEKKRKKWIFNGLLLLLAGFFAAGYARLFFSIGVDFGDAFLEKQEESSHGGNVVYQELLLGASVAVKAEKDGSAQILCSLPDGEAASYTVQTEQKNGTVSAVILDTKKKEICRGTLVEETLLDSNGKVYDQPVARQKDERYEHSPRQLVSIARGNLHLRGRWGFFLAGVVLLAFLAADLWFSVSYFAMVNLVNWKRPVPCEFFCVVQGVLRGALAVGGMWLLLLAVFY